ncbi:autotransporter outer membrane beta-barrel domain-containing protein [Bordetella genomosp. 13]|uniref:autotransporter outer membrane beta-barrel domain-containing protein n=1 Tax=Bordetella genomosp. 13 TaxID=463040 RepID=UPI0011A9CDFF|nr:autotransporter outer membrane beta-barrel domain-containing protein [Bordetella genomosp. 13]
MNPLRQTDRHPAGPAYAAMPAPGAGPHDRGACRAARPGLFDRLAPAGLDAQACMGAGHARHCVAPSPWRNAARLSVLSCALMAAGYAAPAQPASVCHAGTPSQAPASGGNCSISTYHPPTSYDGAGGAVVTGGDVITLQGTSPISTGYSGNTTVDSSTVTVVSGTFQSQALTHGAQSMAVTGPNDAAGINQVYRVYDSSVFADRSNANTPVQQFEDVAGDMYYRASLGKVDQGGGTLNVNLGAAPAGTPSANRIMMVSKQTYLTSADGTGAAASTVSWQSRNQVDLGIDPGLPTPDENGIVTVYVPVTTYAGAVTFNGVTHTITNATQLAAYNDALVAALKSGVLASQDAYDRAFAMAYATTNVPVRYQTNTTAGDLARTPNGDRYAMLAQGANGAGVVALGAQIDATRASGAIKAAQGATVTNNGTLSGNIVEQVVRIESGAHFVNASTGVVASGYLAGDRLDTATQDTFYYTGSGILATGAGSTVRNSGIVNTAGLAYANNLSAGIGLAQGASGVNDGTINAGVNPGYASTVVGVNVSGGSSFTNAADGTIYVGRAAQYTQADATTDVAITAPTYGIRIMDTGDRAVNEGQVIIGAGAQNAVAMYSTAPVQSLLQNNGTITIRGAADGTPLANVGMMADDNGAAGTNAIVHNAGTINLDGINGIGMLVNANPGTAANAQSSGTINVNGGLSPASGTRNIGVWVDGALATARIGGTVNLSGTGAIGIYAQDGGTVHVAAGATPRFLAGTDQIGFYAAGTGSAIDVADSALSVTTDRSTMFRVADGAAFNGTTAGGALRLTITGADARGVVATGMGATLSTGSSTYDVTGAAGPNGGAAAIVVEGGATGTIDSATTIALSAAGATAGIVDGQGLDVSGAARGTPVTTLLENRAQIASASAGVTGFVARDRGVLVNDAAVSLDGAASTGVVVGTNGEVRNNGLIRAADGVGAHVRGADALLVNDGTLQADDGTAAVRLSGAGASVALTGAGRVQAAGTAAGVLLDDTATGAAFVGQATRITSQGSGAAIDNRAGGGQVVLADSSVSATGTQGVGIRASGSGAVLALNRTAIQGVSGGIALSDDAGSAQVSRVTMTGGSVDARSGNAVDVAGAHAAITVRGGATLAAGSGILLRLSRNSVADFTAEGVSLRGDVIADDGSRGTVNLRAGAMLTGRVDPMSVDIDAGSTWRVTADSRTDALSNAGTVAFIAPTGDPTRPASYGTVTTQRYTGNGLIVLNTYLGSGPSASDRLLIDGGAATGATALRIDRTAPAGALTAGDGINVVATANGGTTAPGTFRLASPVQAGPYEYLLYRGGSADPQAYYLRSFLGAGNGDTGAEPPVAYRPATVGYALTPALNLGYGFANLGRLQERVGDVASTERGQQGNAHGIWGRAGGSGINADTSSRYAVKQQTFFMQFGRDWTLSRPTEGGSTHAGVTASLGTANAKFRDRLRSLDATLSEKTGSTTTQAQSLGGYYTLYGPQGGYWDSVAQATRYHNKYYDAYGGKATQNGYGLVLSQEVGQPLPMAGRLAIEPQAQLAYQYLKLRGFDDGISDVSGNGNHALRGRLGLRIFVPGLDTADGSGSGTPYLTADVLHDFIGARRVWMDGTAFREGLGRTWAEVGGGLNIRAGQSGQLYATVKVARNLGGDDRRGVYGQVGYRYSW